MFFRNKIYFALKPILPWRLRYFARRLAARRVRARAAGFWPIDEAAGMRPEGLPGWPSDKQFAFVLTHDVEGPEGLENCRRTAELEMSLGFRSSFNFIPEGAYTVPPALRRWLEDNGFEVGIHDLHHDGKLFANSESFAAKAKRINYYVKEWGAKGFRAGFMLRNLEWFQQLDIQYDSSTFDTDPFEPQPDGSRTIFPFWVAGSADVSVPSEQRRGDGRNGYVELPYTLPQDSTLFLLLEERTTEVWRRKLSWLVERRGMAMVNVHPDYLRFEGDSEKRSTYPAELYASFLREVAGNYAGRYWPALPRQVADWYAANAPRTPAPTAPGPLAGKRAAVLLYSNYPSDPRPRRAAEAMVEAGMAVDLLCLSQTDDDAQEEVVKGVRVFRHPMRRRRDGVSTYIWQYARFVLAAFWFLSRRGWRKKYDVVHVHNMPDFLAFAAVGAKVRGARLVLDLHDPSPELMMTIFGLPARHWFVRTLRLVERLSIGLSDIVLTPNITFKDLFVSRSCRGEKVEIVMNSPDPAIFSRSQGPVEMANPGESGEFRVMHHGLIAHRHGVDLLVEAVALLHRQIPSIRLDIYGGETPFLAVVLQRASELGIGPIVRYHGSKSQAEIAAAIQRCHVGIVPNRRSVFTEINFPTRLFEYLALGRPVVAPCTQGIRDYFAADEMVMFEPGDVAGLAQRIRFIHDEPEQARQYVAKGSAVYARYQWPGQKRHFVGLIEKLLGPRRVKSAGALPERGGVAP